MRFAYRYFLSVIGVAKWWILAGFILQAGIFTTDAIIIWLVAEALTEGAKTIGLLWIAALVVIRMPLYWSETVASQAYGQRATPEVAQKALEHFMRQDAAFHQRHDGAKTMGYRSRLVRIYGRFDSVAHTFCGIGVNIVVMLVIIALNAGIFAIGFASCFFLIGWVVWRVVHSRQKLVTERAEAESRVEDSAAVNAINAFHLIAHGLKEPVLERHKELVERHKEKVVKHGKRVATIWVFTTTSVDVILLTGVAGGWWLLQKGQIEPQTVTFIVMYFLRMSRLLVALHGYMHSLGLALKDMDELEGVLKAQPAVTSPTQPERLRRRHGAVAFKCVSFGYGEHQVLREVDLTFPSGKITALKGRTGSGKTTALALVMRLMDPDEGVVSIDDQDVKTLESDENRRRIAWASQKPMGPIGSIRKSVTLLRPDAPEDEIWEIFRCVQLEREVVEAGGLDASDERLSSAGQRQRLEIARCLLRDADVVLLDEVTANLDPETTEVLMTQVIGLLRKRGVTVIFIAHDMSLLKYADHVVRLENGRLKEER